jgi:hypothetical protein
LKMKDKIISYAALTGENWNTMRVTIKSRESKRAESPKSIAQGNALCNELHPFPSSPERAKSFVNNRLRSEQGSVAHFQFSPVRAAELIFNFQLTKGIACADRANEIEPRPNEGNGTFAINKSRRDDISVERWNNLPILTCHPYGILLTADIFSTDISSLRDFLSATTEINAGIACSDRTNEVEPRPNEGQSLPKNALIVRDCHVAARLAMTALLKPCADIANEIEPRPNEGNGTFAINKSHRDDISGIKEK